LISRGQTNSEVNIPSLVKEVLDVGNINLLPVQGRCLLYVDSDGLPTHHGRLPADSRALKPRPSGAVAGCEVDIRLDEGVSVRKVNSSY